VVRLAKRKDVGRLINACDAGREGELIFRLIEQYAGGQKNGQYQGLGKPVQRLWLQSMTPAAIRDGFEKLRSDEQMRGLADAARSRSEADWLVGINGTRAMTAFNSRDGGFFLTTVGRVQTPTLSIVVEREEQIRAHKSRDYWEIHASFLAEAGEYPGKWFDPAFKKPTGDDADADLRADRLWNQREALAIAEAVRGKAASVTEESKPTTQASGLLYDLTSLQREANGRFGFSAKTTLQLAQSLYERHKALTYPRTDSRALPEDYLGTVKQTFEMLADSGMKHLAPHALTALNNGYIKPSKRIFDNSKVSDHFAIIPTLQAPSGLSEAEQKLYDLVVRRFLAVFFPSAEFMVTTRIQGAQPPLQDRGQGAGQAGLDGGVRQGSRRRRRGRQGRRQGPEPGAGARGRDGAHRVGRGQGPEDQAAGALFGSHAAGRHGRRRQAHRRRRTARGHAGKRPGHAGHARGHHRRPADRKVHAARRPRDHPTAKAFQLMTLLRGLGWKNSPRPELTGEWEYKLAQMEHGKLSRAAFMAEIAAMTERMVKKAKEYDRDTVPGNYATLEAPCPNCGGVVKENYRRYACTGADGNSEGCGFSFTKSPAGRTFEVVEAEAFCATKTSVRWRASAPRRAGPSWPRSCSSTAKTTRTGSWSSTSATTRTPRKPASWWTSPTSERWAPAPSAAARCTSTAPTTCAARRCPRPPSPRPAATSRAARSSCSSRWRASR
jgi:DNA topoisomerase III